MLENLILGQLVLEQAGETQFDELAAQRPAVVAVDEETVMRHLHRDGAEPFADPRRADVAKRGAKEGAPIEAVVVVESAILGGDERGAHLLRHIGERDVDPAYDGQPADQASVAIENAPTLARVKGADLITARAAGEAAAGEPGVKHEDARDGERER